VHHSPTGIGHGEGLSAAENHLSFVTLNPPITPGATEELLRYDPPLQLVSRSALAGTEVAGHHVSAGKRRLRPMRGPRTDTTTQVVITGHAFVQNLRRGHYELGVDAAPAERVAAAFTELAQAI
jgi:hypothetical protein